MDITIAPLIDIVFLLLIFFMLITRYLNPGITVDVPKSSTSEAVSSQSAIVAVTSDGIFLDNLPLKDTELESKLVRLKSDGNIASIRVRAEKTIDIQRLVDIFDIIRKAGISEITLETMGVNADDQNHSVGD